MSNLIDLVERAVAAVRRAPAWQGVLAYDELWNCVRKLRVPSDDDFLIPGSEVGIWADNDNVRCAHWLSRVLHEDVSSKTAERVMRIVAEERRFHPVRVWLESLSWDGVPRIHDWLRTYLSATERHEGYLRDVGSKFLVAAIARAMEPGRQNDAMPVLVGEALTGKSRAIRALAGASFYGQEDGCRRKNWHDPLRGRWIVEIEKWGSFLPRELRDLRRSLSQTSDRVPHSRRSHEVPRQSVFIGSVNRDTHLTDRSLTRQIWPVTCGTIHVQSIERDRAQLWAEALVAYRGGKTWWLEADMLASLNNTSPK